MVFLLVGVYAAGTQTIHLSGNVNFDVSDRTLYVKDVRIKDDNSLSGQGSTIDGFMPGFVNGDFNLDLGSVTSAAGEFTLYIDVINTSTTACTASTDSTLSNATLSVSGQISGDGIAIGDIANTESISGTIVVTITFTAQTSGTINLNDIIIIIEEFNGYNVTLNIASSVPNMLQIIVDSDTIYSLFTVDDQL